MDENANQKSLVSVIIPAYNHEKFIEYCLNSVINQSYKNVEIIIINDGSKDTTEEKILKIIGNFSEKKIEFISQENQGVCKTLNKGISMASGKYVSFIASDDVWSLDKIEKQVKFMETNPEVALVFGDAKFIIDNLISEIKYSDYRPILNKLFIETNSIRNIYMELLTENFIPSPTPLIRKGTLDKIGNFDENIGFEDYDMWLRISKYEKIGYIPDVLSFYRIHTGNSSNSFVLMIKGTLKAMFKQFKEEPLKYNYFHILKIIIIFGYKGIKNKINKNRIRYTN